MQLHTIDWIIIVLYLIFSISIGIAFVKKGSKSIVDFFVSGRSVPWWLAGISMVATTFAADTPLAVTGLVVTRGIAQNWIWWSMVFSGMLAVFFFARLWRRSEVLTEVEFVDIRYSGPPAIFLRGFRAFYLAFPINLVIIGWVCLAMQKVVMILIGSMAEFQSLDPEHLKSLSWRVIYILFALTTLYIFLSGLWGVLATDFFQFIIAMIASISLAFFAVQAVDGIDGLKSSLQGLGPVGMDYLRFLPKFTLAEAASIGTIGFPLFLAYITLQWWASSYPGAEPGGGSYIAQRMFSAKNPKHATLAALLFNIAHYALRPWPWILVALCAIVLFPELTQPDADAELGYPMMIVKLMPPGFLGLIIVGFLAAFMSTISTQINLATSYIVNDIYKPFLAPDKSVKHYVTASRIATVLFAILGIIVGMQMDTIKGAWQFILTLSAGTGAVFILRWYWWRINAWTEISAMIASSIIAISLILYEKSVKTELPFEFKLLVTTLGSTAIWVLATFLTPPEPMEKLESFFRKVRPGGMLWSPVASRCPDVTADQGLTYDFGAFVFGSAFILLILFGSGKLLLGFWGIGFILSILGLASGALTLYLLNKKGWDRME